MKISFLVRARIEGGFAKGTERLVYDYAKFLKGRGKEVEILLSDLLAKEGPGRNPDSSKIRKKYAGIERKELRFSHFKIPGVSISPTYLSGMPDYSIIYIPYNYFEYLANFMKKPESQPYIFAGHCLEMHDGHISQHGNLEKALNKVFLSALRARGRSFRASVYFHAVNREQEKYFLGLGISRANVFYIPNFIETKDFRIGANTGKRLRVVHIGGVHKNSERVADIIEELGRRGKLEEYEFYFIGRKQPESLEKLSGLNRNVKILGYASDRAKADILASSNVVIIPAMESFGLPIIEGLASGLAVLSRKNPAAEEAKALGANIYIVKDSSKEYATALEALRRMESAGALGRKERQRNRKIAEKNFSKEAVLPKIEKMFKKIEQRYESNRE